MIFQIEALQKIVDDAKAKGHNEIAIYDKGDVLSRKSSSDDDWESRI